MTRSRSDQVTKERKPRARQATDVWFDLFARVIIFGGGGAALFFGGLYLGSGSGRWVAMALGVFSWLQGSLGFYVLASELKAISGRRIAGAPAQLDQDASTPEPPATEAVEMCDPVLGRLVFDGDVDGWWTRALDEHGLGRILVNGRESGPKEEDLEAARFYFAIAARVVESARRLLRESTETREWKDWAEEIDDLRVGDLWIHPAHRGKYTAMLSFELRSPEVFGGDRSWRCEIVGHEATGLGFDS